MSTLGKMAGVIAGFFAMSFLGLLSIFAPKYSDRLYVRMIEWADESD
tara:strand:- start:1495 stop:1635 length:141 start_codon:yes stop_codon:yes gene_type:complete